MRQKYIYLATVWYNSVRLELEVVVRDASAPSKPTRRKKKLLWILTKRRGGGCNQGKVSKVKSDINTEGFILKIKQMFQCCFGACDFLFHSVRPVMIDVLLIQHVVNRGVLLSALESCSQDFKQRENTPGQSQWELTWNETYRWCWCNIKYTKAY